MLDMRLYSAIDVYDDDTKTSGYTELVTPEDDSATSIEVVANKVVKFLLTSYGSDPFDPDYGGVAFTHMQISKAYLPKLKLELLDDIERCATYINKGEAAQDADDDSNETLYQITLQDLSYDPYTNPTRVDAYVEITTNSNKKAVVSITNETDS